MIKGCLRAIAGTEHPDRALDRNRNRAIDVVPDTAERRAGTFAATHGHELIASFMQAGEVFLTVSRLGEG
jgi:hypothetical protein